jgi:hypothetical protein
VTGVATELVLLEEALAKTTAAILLSTNQLTDAKTEKTKGRDTTAGHEGSRYAAAAGEKLSGESGYNPTSGPSYLDEKGNRRTGKDPALTAVDSSKTKFANRRDQGKAEKRARALEVDEERQAAVRGEDISERKKERIARWDEEDEKKRAKAARSNEASNFGMADGGMVYRAEGGSIFQPRGTDTVPAMLTPGEFVVRKSAVDKIGASNLSVLNRGVGFMKNLNRGQSPGFRRGGLIGRGVQYKGRGGSVGRGGMSLMLDTTNIQGVLDNFHAEFAASLDNVVGHFSGMTSAMNNLAGAIKQGMAVTHNFTGDLALAFKIENADVLKKTIADAITPTLAEIISREIDQKLNKDFKPG